MSWRPSRGEVIGNLRLAQDIYRLRLWVPDIAPVARPGQFFMVRLPGLSDPLLPRALALYDLASYRQPDDCLDLVYRVVGKMTRLLAQIGVGHKLDITGPLGRPFPPLAGHKQLILIAGGIGHTPFLSWARQVRGLRGYGQAPPAEEVTDVTLYYGVRSAAYLSCVEDFEAAGVRVHLASEDGSVGFRGTVMDLVEQRLPAEEGQVWAACGPEGLLRAAHEAALRRGVTCWVSLETPMACGIGLCFGCVARWHDPASPLGWDYRRVCLEGPVVDSRQLVWL
ncbi:MAG: dihydroorotate dehydrogenase electron transfer subunit [Gemmataceae bacterium]